MGDVNIKTHKDLDVWNNEIESIRRMLLGLIKSLKRNKND